MCKPNKRDQTKEEIYYSGPDIGHGIRAAANRPMHCVLQDEWLKEGAFVHYRLARRQQSILWELPTNRIALTREGKQPQGMGERLRFKFFKGL